MVLELVNCGYSSEELNDCGWLVLELYHYIITSSYQYGQSMDIHVTMMLLTDLYGHSVLMSRFLISLSFIDFNLEYKL